MSMDGNIFVLKTSVKTSLEVELLSLLFQTVQGIKTWSIDLGDWEKILRIESDGVSEQEIVALLRRQGIMCRPMKTDPTERKRAAASSTHPV